MRTPKILLFVIFFLTVPASTASASFAATGGPAPERVRPSLAPAVSSVAEPTTTFAARFARAQSSILGWGDQGPAVRQVQQQLQDLRFWVGPVDGDFGWLTEQAVYAFQKANGITVDGLVGPETRAALADPVVPTPRSDQGRVIEIDKTRQLLYAVADGALQWVFHTSTGTEEPYQHPAGHTAMADTPPGAHSVFWQVDGWDEGVLGDLYRPKYFHEDGIAVHGYGDVPPYPASHGCVRVTFAAMDHIWANDLMPMGGTVLVY